MKNGSSSNAEAVDNKSVALLQVCYDSVFPAFVSETCQIKRETSDILCGHKSVVDAVVDEFILGVRRMIGDLKLKSDDEVDLIIETSRLKEAICWNPAQIGLDRGENRYAICTGQSAGSSEFSAGILTGITIHGWPVIHRIAGRNYLY